MNFLSKRDQGTDSVVKVKWHIATRKELHSYDAPSGVGNRVVHLRRE